MNNNFLKISIIFSFIAVSLLNTGVVSAWGGGGDGGGGPEGPDSVSNSGVSPSPDTSNSGVSGPGNTSNSGVSSSSGTSNSGVSSPGTSNSGITPDSDPVVSPAPLVPVPTCTLTIDPDSINNGEFSAIYWTSTNATSVIIDQGIGGYATEGSYSIYPTTTTTYTGTVTGAGGTATCSDTITVVQPTPAPTCTLTISPDSIENGDFSAIYWTSTNATSVIIDQGIGGYATEGSYSIYPTTTTTYTGTVTGAGGTATCSKTITVTESDPAPTCALSVSPSSVTTGGSTTLSWSVTGGATLNINGIGWVSTPSGSQSVSPSVDTTYTAMAYGSGGYGYCETTVTITTSTVTPAPTCSMSASPTAIAPGDSSTLTWTTTNVASASIDNSIGSVNTSDSTSVTPSVDTTYTGTFVGTDGSTISCNATVAVTTTPAAPTCTMSFDPTAVATGGSSTLTWTSTNTTSGTIDNGVGSVSVNGSSTITPTAASTYTGTFTGPNGTATCSASISVSSSVCTVNCGGGNNPPSVSLSNKVYPGVDPEPSYVYLSQVPYTGSWDEILKKFIFVKTPEFIMANETLKHENIKTLKQKRSALCADLFSLKLLIGY